MYFINAKELLNACIEAGVLQGVKDDYVFVYRQAGTPKETYPEGWYKMPLDDEAQELMDDEEGIKCLENALREKGIEPEYTDIAEMMRTAEMFASFFETMAENGHVWTGDGQRVTVS